MTIMTDTTSVHSGRDATGADGTARSTEAATGSVANPRRLRLGESGTPMADTAAKDAQTAA